MASFAYTEWVYTNINHIGPLASETDRSHALDSQLAISEEILHAYIVAISGYFQAYVRDICDEAANLIANTAPEGVRSVILNQFCVGRKLDNGNVPWCNLVADLKRFEVNCATDLGGTPERDRRKTQVDDLNKARNYAAHKLRSPPEGVEIGPAKAHEWRRLCESLVVDIERVMTYRLQYLLGRNP